MKTLREALTLVGLLAPIAFLAAHWTAIPAIVPIHYGLNGQPNRFGSRDTLWLLPAIATLLYGFLHFIARFPHLFNLPVAATDPRRPHVEAMALDLLGWMRLEIAWLFGFLTWSSVVTARHIGTGLPVWFTPFFVIVTLSTVGIFIQRSRKFATS
jgi:hypothetical protein